MATIDLKTREINPPLSRESAPQVPDAVIKVDLDERALWSDYMAAYQDAISATAAPHAPWFVVPADDKLNARIIISEIVLDAMKSLKMTYPAPDRQRVKELQAMKKQTHLHGCVLLKH